MATREKMIQELTENELWWLVENHTDSDIEQAAKFFARGGFTAYDNEKLEKHYNRVFWTEEV